VINEARSAASAAAAFSIRLHSVQAVRDVFGEGGHVFLVPDEGAKEIALLNSSLYGGVLSWAHRADIPFVPHITVAASQHFSECEALAATIAGDHRDMFGAIGALTVVEIVGGRVANVADLPLGCGSQYPQTAT
jgi:hypothetical protein